jgi:hypothetical protein
MKYGYLKILGLVFLFWLLFLSHRSAAENKTSWIDNFHLGFHGGFQQSAWRPGLRRDIITYDTEGLQSFELGSRFYYMKKQIFTFDYERPVRATEKQNSILKKNKTQNPGLEKFNILFSLKALSENFSNVFMKTLLSAELSSSLEMYYGTAKGEKNFAYVNRDATVTKNPNDTVTFSNLERIRKGDSVSFSTEFRDTSLTFAWPWNKEVWPWNGSEPTYEIRLGVYSVDWQKPSDHDRAFYTVVDDLLIVYDTTFQSKGGQFTLYATHPRGPGFKYYFNLRWGFFNEVKNVVQEIYDKPLYYGSFLLNVWYNWYPVGGDDFYLTLGHVVSRRAFTYEMSLFSGGIDRDDLLKIYARIGYVF